MCNLKSILNIFRKNPRRSFGRPTKFGKQLKADFMYRKGLEFIGASILLKQQGGRTFVQIHLLLQGLEIILKSLLIRRDYEKYNKKLKGKFGHNILKLVNEVKKLYGLKNINKTFDQELKATQGHYMSSNLRYGSLLDIFIDVNSISVEAIETKTYKLIRILEDRRQKSSRAAST
jgi:hypothetical protein